MNPILTTVENRYLAERLVMSEEQSVGALAAVVQRVRENRLVSITLGSYGRQLRTAPCVSGLLRVAIGAPVLAHRTGAALLPVFTVQTNEGVFVTTVEAPLEVEPGLEREAALQSLVTQYATLLESYVLRWPAQHIGWDLLTS